MDSVFKQLLTLFVAAVIALPAWSQGMPFGNRTIRKPETLLIIHAGALLAVPGEAPLAEQSIVVRNGRIEAVVDGISGPKVSSRAGRYRRLSTSAINLCCRG